jgi:hypothetical protein
MSREARVVAEDVPHLATLRGNNRQNAFLLDDDRRFYIETLRATYPGLPIGIGQFVDEMERRLSRRLRPKPPGPTPKAKIGSARSK